MSQQRPQWVGPSQGVRPNSQADNERWHYAQMPPHLIKNPYATRSLIYGILSFIAMLVSLFSTTVWIGLVGLYAIYYSFKGISLANKLPGRKGLAPSIIGLVLSILGVVGTIGIIILSAVLRAS
jgi:hypothetical protein